MKNNRKYKTEELYSDKRITDELETLEESIELANREIRQLIDISDPHRKLIILLVKFLI